ncbi:unnamed protein product [Cuscuta epithymum]|uniref:Kinesin-like protein n=2 Tax=Cuscuta epithymum TaxID=186058 RepID=A0AAV0G7K5_9ASTE|nr:unnamed protein product [Cuscuta epithymum]
MNTLTDRLMNDYGMHNTSSASPGGDTQDSPPINHNDLEVKERESLVQWLNSILPHLRLSIKSSEEELRAVLLDGSVLCQLVVKLKPDLFLTEAGNCINSSGSCSEHVRRFLSAMEKLGLPRFEASDLENGSMKAVFHCLIALQTQFREQDGESDASGNVITTRRWKSMIEHYGGDDDQREESFRLRPFSSFGEERWKLESKSQRALRSPVMAAALIHHIGHKFHEVFELKQGSYADLPASKISEMMKSNSLDNAPTQSLLTVVNGIIDECIARKNGEIPQRVACLLRKVVQEIERRISTQAEHLRMQNNLFKAREEKYQSRIRVLEALATGTSEETQIVMNQLQQLKSERTKMEVKKKTEEHDMTRLMKGKDDSVQEITALKQNLEIARETYEFDTRISQQEISNLKQELETAREAYKDCFSQLESNNRNSQQEISSLKQELETTRKGSEQEIETLKKEIETICKTYDQRFSEMEKEAKGSQTEMEEKLKESTRHLTETRNRLKECEMLFETRSLQWKKKQNIYEIFTEFQLGALRELKFSSHSIRHEVIKTQKVYTDEFKRLGVKTRALEDAAANYHVVLAENKKLHNEVQELKGNIRVYCRVRPFLPGQMDRQTIVNYIGENGELIVTNPSKQGREGRRSFKFNKVYAPAATQAQVFSDIQPLIRSVLDGYSVCIFAYGQTGSGKTYTMTGPDRASEEEWGVNYRALNDLFQISQKRVNATAYEISVQMVEIYNEQIRDLLSNDNSHKNLAVLPTTQPNGLTVPDASMYQVNSTADVLDLMNIGLKNRSRSSTALNERSSRSHSVVTIHVCGTDIKSGSSMRSSLHLVDLAGSERVDRSEVKGDRLKEAQHINKSLAALGDVISALAQKSPHIPYRNSKLTQVLQSSLGGQAKTLMFVQLNPDLSSYSESVSTLKFAERVSGVELGAAKSSKDVKDVKELMEQIASLKDALSKRDEEMDKWRLGKDIKNVMLGSNGEKRSVNSLRH